MAGEADTNAVEQRGPIRRAGQPVVEPGRFGQAVAQLAEIARRTTPRHQPAKRAPEIGRGAQNVAQLCALDRTIPPELHQREPRLDGGGIQQGRGQILRQQARARPGDAAIHRADEAPRAPALGGFQYLKASPRCGIHRHRALGLAQHRGQQQWQLAAPDMIEIGDQAPRCAEHRAGESAEGIERRHPMHRLQPLCPGIAGEGGAGAENRCIGGILPVLRHHHLAWAQPRQHCAQRLCRAFLQHHCAGGDIDRRNSHCPAQFRQGDQNIGPARFQQGFLGERPCRHQPDNGAADQRL